MNTTSNGSRTSSLHRKASREGRDLPLPAEIKSSASPSVPAAQASPIRIIVADSEAIFRVGIAKIFAAESDFSVVALTESYPELLEAIAAAPIDVILFEVGLSPTPADAVTEIVRTMQPETKLIVVTSRAGEQETVDYLRRGVRGILSRATSSELLIRCVRKVWAGETWLDKQGVNWIIEAYRSQALQGGGPKQQLRLSEKDMLIISGVTQGLKNKDIAREIGTTEQVVKNYLRKIYDKLQVVDRLELALYAMHHRLLEGYVPQPGRPGGRRSRLALRGLQATNGSAPAGPSNPPAAKEPAGE